MSRLKFKIIPACCFLFFAIFSNHSWADEWVVLAPDRVFTPLRADPHEPVFSIGTPDFRFYYASFGGLLDIVQWNPAKEDRWAWGAAAGGFFKFEREWWASFSELANDWEWGFYVSQKSGRYSGRLEYRHALSLLGDHLFRSQVPLNYSRDSLQYLGAFEFLNGVRAYAGPGYWVAQSMDEKPFFLQAGIEWTTDALWDVLGRPMKGFFAYDLQLKDEDGGIWNHHFQLGVRFEDTMGNYCGPGLALIRHVGNSEFGQFFLQKDDFWGMSLLFSP